MFTDQNEDLDENGVPTGAFLSALNKYHRFCLDNDIMDAIKVYVEGFVPETIIGDEDIEEYYMSYYSDDHYLQIVRPILRDELKQHTTIQTGPRSGYNYRHYFMLRGQFDRSGVYEGNMTIRFSAKPENEFSTRPESAGSP